MKKEDFAKTREELKDQKKKNNNQFYINDERNRMAKVNQFEYKAIITVLFSMFGYMLLFFVPALVTHSLGVSAFANMFPGYSYSIAMLTGSVVLGTIGRILMEKKFQLKERLKDFTSAKKQADLLEEEIKYQIELEKVNNKNLAISQAEMVLNYQEETLKRMSSRYDIYDKEAPKTEEEAKQRIEELSVVINKKYETLDLLTMQKVLHDRFWKVRAKWQKNLNLLIAPMFGAVGAMLFTVFPMMAVRGAIVSGSTFSSLAIPLISMVVGASGALGYMMKRNRDYSKVFRRFNSKLGNNGLSETITDAYQENQELAARIESELGEISVATVQLKEQQRALETITAEHKEEKDSKELEQEPPVLMPTELNFGQSEVSDETQLSTGEEKGPTLIKRKK